MNKKRYLTYIIVFMLLSAACEKDYYQTAPAVDPNTPVSYSTQVQPIFTEDCATAGCHVTGIQSPDLSAGKSYDQLMQLGYVDTTDAESSLLYKRIISTTKPMPPTGKLSNTEISLILTWIEQGAPNN